MYPNLVLGFGGSETALSHLLHHSGCATFTEDPGAERSRVGHHSLHVRPEPSPDLFARSTSQPGPELDTDKLNMVVVLKGSVWQSAHSSSQSLEAGVLPLGTAPPTPRCLRLQRRCGRDSVTAAAGTSCLLPPGSCIRLHVETCAFWLTKQAAPVHRAACRG